MISILDITSRQKVFVKGSDLIPQRNTDYDLMIQKIEIDRKTGYYTVHFFGAISRPLSPHHKFDLPQGKNFDQFVANRGLGRSTDKYSFE